MRNDDNRQTRIINLNTSESLVVQQFCQWFKALMGFTPFEWQKRLFLLFLKNDIPSALDIPTGLGKTSLMVIWLLARALNPCLPRRLIYIVDRRVVVDQATAVAEQLNERLRNNPECAFIAEMLGLDDGKQLPISTLRGQLADNKNWLEKPTNVAIVIGTIDMIGSRLLFSGYRASRRMRPVHAALLGVDALVLLDEAHLVAAFHRTLKQIEKIRRQTKSLPFAVPPLHVMALSATSRQSQEEDIFRLDEEDRRDELVAQRVGAIKRLKFIDIITNLSDALAERALLRDGSSHGVIVFCQGRNEAQRTADILRKGLGKDRTGDVLLLTGAQRGHERDMLAILESFKAFQHYTPKDGRTRFLVCTAAGEVGADLSGEHAVMDLVTLERMIQRLGRINRRGEFALGSDIEVLINRTKLTETLFKGQNTKKARHQKRLISILTKTDRVYDASPSAIEALLKRLDTKCRNLLWTPDPPTPRLRNAHVEAWTMTSLTEHPGRSEVVPFLRGITDEKPECEVVWRADIHSLVLLAPVAIAQALEAAPPHPSEVLKEEASSVAKKLLGRMEKIYRGTDRENIANSPPFSLIVTRDEKVSDILSILEISKSWQSDRKKQEEEMVRVLSYATLWLPCSFGGLDEDGLFAINATRGEEPPRDVSSPLRLIVDLETKIATPSPHGWPDGISPANKWEEQLRTKRWRRIFTANLPATDDSIPAQCLEYWAPPKASHMNGETGTAPKAQSLTEHHQWAEFEATVIADTLKLPEWLKSILRMAALHHDSGKQRDLWQHAMRADREPALLERPLAKTTNRRSGNLGGYRHELGSLIDALQQTELIDLEDEHRDLVLHLIAAHHGRARPSIPGIDPDVIVPAVLEEQSLAAARRFARMQRRWGPWELAWIESLLRAADVNASRRLEVIDNG